MIFKKPDLKSTFPHPPMAALRQPPNMRKILCRASLYPLSRGDKFVRNSHRNAPGWKKCGRGSTTCCPYTLPPTNQVTGNYTGYTHQIRDAVNCETKNCVYYWKCVKSNCKDFPRCEYVGLSSRSFKERLAEHKQYMRSNDLKKPNGYHFNQAGHDVSHLKGLVLEHVKSIYTFIHFIEAFFIFFHFLLMHNQAKYLTNPVGSHEVKIKSHPDLHLQQVEQIYNLQ